MLKGGDFFFRFRFKLNLECKSIPFKVKTATWGMLSELEKPLDCQPSLTSIEGCAFFGTIHSFLHFVFSPPFVALKFFKCLPRPLRPCRLQEPLKEWRRQNAMSPHQSVSSWSHWHDHLVLVELATSNFGA